MTIGNNEEMVKIEIPKSLYDRVDKFGSVERVIITDLTEWVEIMEDEEKHSEVRFKVYLKPNAILPNCEVINIHDWDRENNFVGMFRDIVTKESLLRIASEGYGIEENEIEFIEIDVRNSY